MSPRILISLVGFVFITCSPLISSQDSLRSRALLARFLSSHVLRCFRGLSNTLLLLSNTSRQCSVCIILVLSNASLIQQLIVFLEELSDDPIQATRYPLSFVKIFFDSFLDPCPIEFHRVYRCIVLRESCSRIVVFFIPLLTERLGINYPAPQFKRLEGTHVTPTGLVVGTACPTVSARSIRRHFSLADRVVTHPLSLLFDVSPFVVTWPHHVFRMDCLVSWVIRILLAVIRDYIHRWPCLIIPRVDVIFERLAFHVCCDCIAFWSCSMTTTFLVVLSSVVFS